LKIDVFRSNFESDAERFDTTAPQGRTTEWYSRDWLELASSVDDVNCR
jgi:hypothetical protein